MQRTHSLAVVLMACLLMVENSGAAQLSAGTASIDLTPPLELNATLGGYGERMSRPAEGVHDRVFAKAVVLSDGNRRLAVLTSDILGFPPAFKPELVRRMATDGWTSRQIMLLPSHSHTSIDMNAINPVNVLGIKQIGIYDRELFEWTIQRCKKVIEQAAIELVPVTIGTSSKAIDGWNRNRRHRDGPTDNWLTVTRIDTTDAKPLVVMVNFTAHPTFMGAKHMMFSGDWPGHLQRALERMIGQNVNVMYYNGAQGDQSPVGRPNSGKDRWEAAEQYGNDLASEAIALWSTIAPRRDNRFDFHLQPIDLPGKSWHPDFMKTGGEEYGLSVKLLEKALPLMFPGKTASGSLRLGDLVIVGVPGEMAAELGLAIKREVREITATRHVAIGGLANEWISYILSAEEYERGGYEASVSFYGAQLARHIVDGTVAGVKNLASSAESLTIALVSPRCMFGDVNANVQHFTQIIEDAAANRARLICFPELALTSYSTHADVLKSAEEIPGPTTQKLDAIAKRLNVYISVGMAERNGDRYHITQVLVGPQGYLGKYRKNHPTGGEQICGFAPGQSFPTWEIDGFRFGMLICFDGRHQDTIEAMKKAHVDIIHHPHGNTVGRLGREAEEWTRSKMVYFVPRAVQARAHILVNNSAEDTRQPHATLRYSSGALVVDALGQVVARTTQKDRKEKTIIVTLNKPAAIIPEGELRQLKSDPVFNARFQSN